MHSLEQQSLRPVDKVSSKKKRGRRRRTMEKKTLPMGRTTTLRFPYKMRRKRTLKKPFFLMEMKPFPTKWRRHNRHSPSSSSSSRSSSSNSSSSNSNDRPWWWWWRRRRRKLWWCSLVLLASFLPFQVQRPLCSSSSSPPSSNVQ